MSTIKRVGRGLWAVMTDFMTFWVVSPFLPYPLLSLHFPLHPQLASSIPLSLTRIDVKGSLDNQPNRSSVLLSRPAMSYPHTQRRAQTYDGYASSPISSSQDHTSSQTPGSNRSQSLSHSRKLSYYPSAFLGRFERWSRQRML